MARYTLLFPGDVKTRHDKMVGLVETMGSFVVGPADSYIVQYQSWGVT